MGLFAVLEPRNQDILLWGKTPTAVHKLCMLSKDMPEQSDIADSLNCTLLAISIGNRRVCEVRRALTMQSSMQYITRLFGASCLSLNSGLL